MYSHVVAIGLGTAHGYGYEGVVHNWQLMISISSTVLS